jgi:hypothetical protein
MELYNSDCLVKMNTTYTNNIENLRDAGYCRAFLRGKPVWVRCLREMSVFRVWKYNQSTGALGVWMGLWKKAGKEDTQQIKVRRMT